MDAGEDRVLLLRYGELSVKGAFTRRRMQSLLARNVEKALEKERVDHSGVRVTQGRIVVWSPDPLDRGLDVLSRVFGVVGVAPAWHRRFTGLDEVLEWARDRSVEAVRGRRFKVEARRVGVEGFTSMDVRRRLGALLVDEGGVVDLRAPEVVVNIEVRGEDVFLYHSEVRGPGGLPLGSEGRVLALVSGGFDSPVAAWMAMKRGTRVDIVFFNLGGREHELQARAVSEYLACRWGYGVRMDMYLAEMRWIFPILNARFPQGFWTVVLKRAMFIAAEALARRIGAKALVTGESLAQVASQTLHNLAVTDEAVEIMVLRPLIGMDKQETMDLARRIGTYPISEKTQEFCAIASPKPSTAVDRAKLNKLMEKHLPRETILENTLPHVHRIRLGEECNWQELTHRAVEHARIECRA